MGATRYANARRCYGTAPENIRRLQKIIRNMKKEGCFVVPYFHWGYEYIRTPSPHERKIARVCINTDAYLVVGSHPHIYQAVEKYKKRMIFYSLVNYTMPFIRYDTKDYMGNWRSKNIRQSI